MTVPLLKKKEKSFPAKGPMESQNSTDPEVDLSTCTIQTSISMSPGSISTNEEDVCNIRSHSSISSYQDICTTRVRLVFKFSVRTFSSRAHMKCEPTGLCVTDKVLKLSSSCNFAIKKAYS